MSLPANWTSYTTDDGKEYFHNSVTNATTWDRPAAPEAPPFDTADAEVFTYQPTTQELEASANLKTEGLRPSAPTLSFDSELVSLRDAPGGKIAQASPDSASGPGTVTSFGVSSGSAGGAAASLDQASGLAGWAFGWAQKVFDVSTEDIVQRLRLAMTPFMEPMAGVKEEFRARPDFYGPFWIATTAVLFLAATGNFASLLEAGDHTKFKADYGLVSLAAGMIYGSLLAVPLLARAAIFISGDGGESVDLVQLICVCGYSLAPVIPVSLLCIIPLGLLRWLAAFAGLGISLLFLRNHLWAELNIDTPWLKYTMIGGPCVVPMAVLLVYRLHFFSSAPPLPVPPQ